MNDINDNWTACGATADDSDYRQYIASLEELASLDAKASELIDVFERIYYKDSINQKEALALEACGVQFPDRAPIRSFTLQDSKTNLSIAMEGIFSTLLDILKKLIKAVVAFFALIGKMISGLLSWIAESFGGKRDILIFENKKVKSLSESDRKWLKEKIEHISPVVFQFIVKEGIDFNKINITREMDDLNATCSKELSTLGNELENILDKLEKAKISNSITTDIMLEMVRTKSRGAFTSFFDEVMEKYRKVQNSDLFSYIVNSNHFDGSVVSDIKTIPKIDFRDFPGRNAHLVIRPVIDVPVGLKHVGAAFSDIKKLNVHEGIRFKDALLFNPEKFLEINWAKAERSQHMAKKIVGDIGDFLKNAEKNNQKNSKDLNEHLQKLEKKIKSIQDVHGTSTSNSVKEVTSAAISYLRIGIKIYRDVSSASIAYYKGVLNMTNAYQKSIITMNNLMRDLIKHQGGESSDSKSK